MTSFTPLPDHKSNYILVNITTDTCATDYIRPSTSKPYRMFYVTGCRATPSESFKAPAKDLSTTLTAGYLAYHVATQMEEQVGYNETHSTREANYSLSPNYEGKAKRDMKSYGPKIRRPHKKGFRTIRSAWIRGSKVCFVCGRDQHSNYEQPRDEVKEAIKRLKEKHHTFLISVVDLEAIQVMCTDNTQGPSREDDEAHWADNKEDDD